MNGPDKEEEPFLRHSTEGREDPNGEEDVGRGQEEKGRVWSRLIPEGEAHSAQYCVPASGHL